MSLHTSSSLLDIVDGVLLAVLAVIVFIVYPVVRYTSRGRHRRHLIADAAIARRLRQLGHDMRVPSDPRTSAAIAATRRRLTDEFRDGAAR